MFLVINCFFFFNFFKKKIVSVFILKKNIFEKNFLFFNFCSKTKTENIIFQFFLNKNQKLFFKHKFFFVFFWKKTIFFLPVFLFKKRNKNRTMSFTKFFLKKQKLFLFSRKLFLKTVFFLSLCSKTK